MANAACGHGTAGENGIPPLERDGLASLNGSKECAADSRIGVRVASARDGGNDGLLERGSAHEPVESILEGGKDPAHLVLEVSGRRSAGGL